MHDISDKHDISTSTGNLSRREFLGLSAGVAAFTIFGVYADGNTVKVAYADENGNLTFSIYVLSAEEVPIMALEPLSDGKWRGVEGVTIELKNAKGSVTAGPTDENGFSPVNIRALADDSTEHRNIYYCYLSVKASKSGYRYFEEYEMLISGIHADSNGVMHNVLRIPTQVDDGKTPYLSEMSLDGQDLQYYTRDVFVHPNNDISHTVTLTLRNAGTKSWGFSFNVNGKSIVTKENVTPSNGVATVDLKGLWLKSGTGGIAPGDKLSVSYYPMGGSKTTILSSDTVKMADLAFPQGYDQACEFAVGGCARKKGDTTVKEQVKIPNWMNKQNFNWNLKIPFLPIELFCDTNDNLGASASLGGFYFFKIKNEKSEIKNFKDRWKPLTPAACTNTFNQQCKDEWERFSKSIDNAMNSEDKIGSAEQSDFLTFSLDLELRGFGKRLDGYYPGSQDKKASNDATDASEEELGLAVADNAENKRTSQMNMGISAMLDVKFTVSFPFFIGFIPFTWGFDLGGTFTVKYMGLLRYENYFENCRWYLGKNAPAAVFSLHFEAGLFLSVGAAGIVCASIRGYGYIRTVVGVYPAGMPTKFAVYCGAGVAVSATILIFTVNKKLCETAPQVFGGRTSEGEETGVGPEYELPDYTTAFKYQEYANLPLLNTADEVSQINLDDLEILTETDLEPCTEFYCDLNDEGEEGCYIDDVWTPCAIKTRDGFEENPVPHEMDIPYDPYNPGEGQDAYNPARGPKVKSVLTNVSVFSDSRQKFVVGNSTITFVYRIAMTEIRVKNQDDSSDKADGFCVVNVEENGLTFPYVLSGEAIRNNDTEAAAIYDALGGVISAKDAAGTSATSTPNVVLSNAKSVTRSRIVISFATNEFPCSFEQTLELKRIPDRVNTWDTDFDAVHYNYPNEKKGDPDVSMRYYLVCSTRRPYDTEKDFDAVFNTQFLTLAEVVDAAYSRPQLYSWNDNDTVIRWLPHIHTAVTDFADKSERSYEVACYFYQCDKAADMSATKIGKAVLTHAGDAEPKWETGMIVEAPSDIAGIIAQGNLQVCGIRTNAKDTYRRPFRAGEGQVRLFAWSGNKTGSKEPFTVFWIEGKPSERVVINNASSVAAMAPVYGEHVIRYIVARDYGKGERKQVFAVEVFTSSDNPTIGVRSVMHDSAVVSFRSVAENAAGPRELYGTGLTAVRIMDGQAPPLPQFAQDAIDDGAELYANRSTMVTPYAAQEPEANDDGKVELYQLLRADWISEAARFTEFYPIAQLDHCPDDIMEVYNWYYLLKGQSNYMSVSKFNLTDVGSAMYLTVVPTGVGIQLEGIEALSLFCMAGDACPIKVTVTSTGTQRLRGFRVTITGGGKSSSTWLLDLSNKEHFLDSVYDYVEVLDKDGNPTGERKQRTLTDREKSYLWPGQTRTYLAKPKIPQGLQGKIEFKVSVDMPMRPGEVPPHPHYSEDNEFFDEADAAVLSGTEEETVVTAEDFGDYVYAQELADEANDILERKKAAAAIEDFEERVMAGWNPASDVSVEPDFRWASPETYSFVVDAGDGITNADGLHPSIVEGESEDGTDADGQKRTAGTGDKAGLSALGAVALGAAAAGVAAYERRRAENEESSSH